MGDPLSVIKAAKEFGIDSVIVAYSSGKDSLAVLDLCFKHFKRVVPYFMYLIKDLDFQEVHLRYVESKYATKIIRVPDWRLCKIMKNGIARHLTPNTEGMPSVKWADVENYIRHTTGLHWIASGETQFESLARRGMIQASKNGVDIPRGHIYPVGFWKRKEIEAYLSFHEIALPCEYRVMTSKRSFGGILMDEMFDIRKHYPNDYAKIKKLFPLADTQAIRYETEQEEKEFDDREDETSNGQDGTDPSKSDQERTVQS
jgi:phosphoadenosine phosphosulfate reductase